MTYPDLTICLLTYKRPWYAGVTLNSYKMLRYAGNLKFHIADGGSDPADFDYYRQVLNGYPVTIEVTANMSAMLNSCVRFGGDVFVCGVDDFALRRPFDITPDVMLLLEHPEIGCIRYSRLCYWGDSNDNPGTSADLIRCHSHLYWRIDKQRTTDSYSHNIGAHLYHKRFYDCYGLVPENCPPNKPGHAEMLARERYNNQRNGVTIAVPMRFAYESTDCYDAEPFWHFGMYRTDEYAAIATTGRL